MIFIFLICFLLDQCSSSFICPEADGTYPDPEDCDQFHVCSNGVHYHQNCPSGLRFNGGGLYCDWPDNVECGLGLRTTINGGGDYEPNAAIFVGEVIQNPIGNVPIVPSADIRSSICKFLCGKEESSPCDCQN